MEELPKFWANPVNTCSSIQSRYNKHQFYTWMEEHGYGGIIPTVYKTIPPEEIQTAAKIAKKMLEGGGSTSAALEAEVPLVKELADLIKTGPAGEGRNGNPVGWLLKPEDGCGGNLEHFDTVYPIVRTPDAKKIAADLVAFAAAFPDKRGIVSELIGGKQEIQTWFVFDGGNFKEEIGDGKRLFCSVSVSETGLSSQFLLPHAHSPQSSILSNKKFRKTSLKVVRCWRENSSVLFQEISCTYDMKPDGKMGYAPSGPPISPDVTVSVKMGEMLGKMGFKGLGCYQYRLVEGTGTSEGDRMRLFEVMPRLCGGFEACAGKKLQGFLKELADLYLPSTGRPPSDGKPPAAASSAIIRGGPSLLLVLLGLAGWMSWGGWMSSTGV